MNSELKLIDTKRNFSFFLEKIMMSEIDKKTRNTNVIAKICHELDHLYDYANSLIPKNITHDLGYKKELLKIIIEDLILIL